MTSSQSSNKDNIKFCAFLLHFIEDDVISLKNKMQHSTNALIINKKYGSIKTLRIEMVNRPETLMNRGIY
jgi:hypothetical protein